jgi:hypothetical protein
MELAGLETVHAGLIQRNLSRLEPEHGRDRHDLGNGPLGRSFCRSPGRLLADASATDSAHLYPGGIFHSADYLFFPSVTSLFGILLTCRFAQNSWRLFEKKVSVLLIFI